MGEGSKPFLKELFIKISPIFELEQYYILGYSVKTSIQIPKSFKSPVLDNIGLPVRPGDLRVFKTVLSC